jgi:hypothetical protein
VGAVIVIIISHTVLACPCDSGFLFVIKPVPTPLAWLGFVMLVLVIFEYCYGHPDLVFLILTILDLKTGADLGSG